MNRRFLLPLVTALAIACGPALAQSAYPASAGPGSQQQEHGGQDRPTPEQRAQIKQIMQEEHERVRQRLSQVLTPAQMQHWEQREQREHAERRMERHPNSSMQRPGSGAQPGADSI